MTSNEVHCRLWFYLARDSDRAVVLRRGPSEHARLILWHTDDDRLELGQWLKHRVEPHCCDVSPSGEYFLYLVKSYTRDPNLWVALSRPPFFSAVAMWPISDAWGGDCSFVDEHQLWIQPGMEQKHLELAEGYRLEHHELITGSFGSDWRWYRNGWRPTVPADHPPSWGKFFLPWEKRDPAESHLLRRMHDDERSHLPGYGTANSFEFVLETGTTTIDLDGVSWADWDRRGRLLMATRSGKLLAGMVDADSLATSEIADLGDQHFEEIPPSNPCSDSEGD